MKEVLAGGAIAIFASFVTTVLTNFFENKRLKVELAQKEKDLLIVKAEELYLQVSVWEKSIDIVNMNHLRGMKGELSVKQVLELCIKTDEELKPQPDRMNMLIAIYIPQLTASYNYVDAKRHEIVKYWFLYRKNPENFNSLEQFNIAWDDFSNAMNEFKKQIATIPNVLFRGK
ncbi:MAG: hypothetical protein LBV09_03365 [Deferribacteraceae bacterium]|jgi:hypothetical protein|nr:hypothetical protein [Deferribacteraceae bacterium]